MTSLSLRDYQREVRDRRDLGLFCLLWRRQGGKTTTFALSALRDMASAPGVLVIFASASLLVGREVTFKEAQLFQALVEWYRASQAETFRVQSIDTANGKEPVKADDFADAFAAGRLETRLYHDRTRFSRTQVVAPNPATARGFSGRVKLDEIGWIKDFQDVWDAMEPIFSSDPTFNCMMATTPPKDDRHYSHELLAPKPGLSFPPTARGHWYRSEGGIMVHRVDVHDAAEAGVRLYHPETREPMTPEAHRATSIDRTSWDRNYALAFTQQSTAACGLLALLRAQAHPESRRCLAIDHAHEGTIADDWLPWLTPAPMALGYDIATTEKETSNPSSLALVQHDGPLFIARLILRWHAADPDVSRAIVIGVARSVRRGRGLPLRGCGIDATNERYYATDMRRRLAPFCGARLVIASETREEQGRPMKLKTYTGNLVVNALEDSCLVLPADGWVKADFRLVRKEKGLFETDLDSAGNHGDSFDAVKLAINELTGGDFRYKSIAAPRGRERLGRRKGVLV